MLAIDRKDENITKLKAKINNVYFYSDMRNQCEVKIICYEVKIKD